MEGSASQERRSSRQRRTEHNSGHKQLRVRRGSVVGACSGRSEQVAGSERRKHTSGRGTSATCSSQTSRILTFLPLLLDGLFLTKENKFSLSGSTSMQETEERKVLAAWQKWAYYYVLVLLRVVFLVAGPKQSNQITLEWRSVRAATVLSQWASLSSSVNKVVSNLWAHGSESRLWVVQSGMLMDFLLRSPAVVDLSQQTYTAESQYMYVCIVCK